MALNIGVKFEGKLTCAFKNEMRNFANFHQTMLESLKIGTLIGSFFPKWKIYELKICRGVMCHENENNAKFKEELTCQFKIDMRNLTNFDLSTRKSQKICTLMGCF